MGRVWEELGYRPPKVRERVRGSWLFSAGLSALPVEKGVSDS